MLVLNLGGYGPQSKEVGCQANVYIYICIYVSAGRH